MAWDFTKKNEVEQIGIPFCRELGKKRFPNNTYNGLKYGGKIYSKLQVEYDIFSDSVVFCYRGQELVSICKWRFRTGLPFMLSQEEADKANCIISLIDEF